MWHNCIRGFGSTLEHPRFTRFGDIRRKGKTAAFLLPLSAVLSHSLRRSLLSVALFGCEFSIVRILGIKRIYTVYFSEPRALPEPEVFRFCFQVMKKAVPFIRTPPHHLRTSQGALVAPQRCPILHVSKASSF